MKKNLLFAFCILFSTIAFAQFPALNWQYYTGAPSFGSAAAADMDKDGFYEIVFTTYTNDGRAHCLNAEDGSVKWIYNIGGCGDVAPIIADVDNDDTLDVIINGSCNPTIFCINGFTGQLKWSKPSGGGDSPPTVADIDGDGIPEVLFCNFNGQLRILNGEDGSTNRIIQVDPYFNPIQTEPTLVDVNNDGHLDIIMANHYNISGLYVWAYDYATSDTIWTNFMADTSSTYNAYHGGAVADVDGDSLMEYVIGSNNGLVRALNVEDGSVLWSKSIPQSDMAPISIADLDHDGTLEVVVTNNDWITYDERIWVLDGLTGNTEWSYPTTFSSFRGCAISDINGDGILDLVAGYYMGDVIAVEPYTGLIWQTNLLQYFPPGLPYFDVDHGPLIADFDHNGKIDVFVVGGYGTYTPDSMNTGKAFMFEAGNGVCPEWLMFRQDLHRDGYLSQAEADSSCAEVMQSVPANESGNADWTMYPNPVRDELNIEIADDAVLMITDVMGKMVLTKKLVKGKNLISTAAFAPGIYHVLLQTENEITVKKVVVIK
jgi:outer membrane protein assembly factor BamB